jgi:hypothetical protein
MLTKYDTQYSTKIMIVADPQILDMQSYPGRPWVLRLLSQVMVDLNLRRSWRAARRTQLYFSGT